MTFATMMPVGTITNGTTTNRTMTKDKVRLSLDVSGELDNLLKDLAKITGGSKSDVLRKAIALMKVATDAQKDGNRIAIVDKNRQIISELVGI